MSYQDWLRLTFLFTHCADNHKCTLRFDNDTEKITQEDDVNLEIRWAFYHKKDRIESKDSIPAFLIQRSVQIPLLSVQLTSPHSSHDARLLVASIARA